MKGAALFITEDALAALVAERVEAILTPERIEALAEARIAERVGMLTPDQAARHLQCKNKPQLWAFCKAHNIPVEHFGAKKKFLLITEIEAAQRRARIALAHDDAPTGTRISNQHHTQPHTKRAA
jgi:hypothetical protein